jgi:hypothetical protein
MSPTYCFTKLVKVVDTFNISNFGTDGHVSILIGEDPATFTSLFYNYYWNFKGNIGILPWNMQLRIFFHYDNQLFIKKLSQIVRLQIWAWQAQQYKSNLVFEVTHNFLIPTCDLLLFNCIWKSLQFQDKLHITWNMIKLDLQPSASQVQK